MQDRYRITVWYWIPSDVHHHAQGEPADLFVAAQKCWRHDWVFVSVEHEATNRAVMQVAQIVEGDHAVEFCLKNEVALINNIRRVRIERIPS